ncbi:MAG: bifunctional riboflavin kinase/FAD synthetase [Agathobacter sp.]
MKYRSHRHFVIVIWFDINKIDILNKMICYKNTNEFHIEEPTALSLGKFDGVHRGHEALIDQLMRYKNQGLKAAVFTFDIPPKKLTENQNYRLLTTNEEKRVLFEERGVDYLLQCPFTPEIMHMEPEDFVEWLVRSLHVKSIVVGTDFHFGHNRRGDHVLLGQLSGQLGYELVVVDKLQYHGRDISSSYVREEILKGNLEIANELLGYPFFVQSEVIHGRQLGRTLGIPTINMELPAEKLLPPKGVYVTRLMIDGHCCTGVTNVGQKPTVNNTNKVSVETHILDYEGDLYGHTLCVSFLAYLRPEQKFASVEELKAQMERDIAAARRFRPNP